MAGIALVDFDGVAESVKPIIESLAISTNTPTLYTDIQAHCQSGRAFIFTDSQGFMVLKPLTRHGISILLVWAAFHIGGNAIAANQKFVSRLGAEIGASFIEFWTARKGFSRIAPSLGWRNCCSILKGGTRLTVWRKSL